MGVDVETLRPGDGKYFDFDLFSGYHVIFSWRCTGIKFGLVFAGKTFPKKGSMVAVHYVGELCFVSRSSKDGNKTTIHFEYDKRSCQMGIVPPNGNIL